MLASSWKLRFVANCLQLYMPITYALNMFGLSFATLSALLVWMFLEKGDLIWTATRRLYAAIASPFGSRTRPSQNTPQIYRDVSPLWYVASSALAIFLSIFAVEYWKVQLRWYGVLLALAVALVFYVPVCHSTIFWSPSYTDTDVALRGVRHVQREDQYRCFLSDSCWLCISRKGTSQHLVLRSWIHFCHQRSLLCPRPEIGSVLQCKFLIQYTKRMPLIICIRSLPAKSSWCS